MKKIFLTLFLAIIILNVKAQDTLSPPQNLQVQIFNNSVTLQWDNPLQNTDYLSWENGLVGTSVGLGTDGTFAVAARWDPQQIPGFVGEQIQKVSIYTTGENSTYTLKIWEGEDAENLIYSQAINSIAVNQWYDVVLDSAIIIGPDLPIWIGYEVNQPAGDFPASIDTGPAVEGYGDLIYYNNEWSSLAAYGFDNNWCIRAYTSGNGDGQQLLPAMKKTESGHQVALNGTSPFFAAPAPVNPSGTNDLLGFNVYRDGELLNPQPLTTNYYYAGTFEPGTYTFGVTAVYDEGESLPAEATIEVGGGFLVFEPFQLNVTVPAGETMIDTLTLVNPGDSDINWETTEYQSWLSLSQTEGTVGPGENEEIAITINASNLDPGYYDTNLLFEFNNAIVPESYYYITVFVEGDPEILINPESLDFGNVETGNTKALSFQVTNTGYSVVTIDSVFTNISGFSVENQTFQIEPWSYATIPVIFAPDSIVSYEGQVLIYAGFSSQPFTVDVSGTGILAPPSYLNAQLINENDAELSWLPPNGNGNGTVLSWDDGINANAVGMGTEATFYYGARWTPEFLSGADGQTAISISFFPFAEESTFTLKIYTGENAANLVVSQPIGTYTPYEWNVVNINNPFLIDSSQELWVTFEVQNADGEYPGGVDAGPAVQGFGDLVSTDGVTWESMSSLYGLPYNWNLRLFATPDISSAPATIISSDKGSIPGQAKISLATEYHKPENPYAPSLQDKTSFLRLDLLGYNVYRNGDQLNDELVSELSYLDTGLENGIYNYGVTAVYEAGESPMITDVVQIGAPEISFNPESLYAELDAGDIITDTILISNNGNVALEWNANSNASFIIPVETSGNIPPGESQELPIIVDATYIGGGTINAAINFAINNLNNPTVSYPVVVNVQGTPDIFVNTTSVNFGNVSPGTTKTRNIEIFNYGFGSAEFFGFSVDNEAFAAPDTNYSIPTYGILQIPVNFAPEGVEDYSGTLTFSTSDPDLPEVSIPLSGSGYLMPPLAFTAGVNESNVQLSWLPPDGGPGDYLQYDDGTNFQSIGLTGGGTYAVAAKWEPDQLISNSGNFVTAIGFFPTSETTGYTIKIWKGPNADSLVTSQFADNMNPYEWNDVFLTNAVEIEDNETYWFGYEIDQPADEFPAGVDNGPSVSGSGDLITLDGAIWEKLSDYGLEYNWNIRAFVSESKGNSQPAKPLRVPGITYENSGYLVKHQLDFVKQKSLKSGTRAQLNGYNVYRNEVLLNSDPLQETNFVDEVPGFGTYFYTVTAVYDAGESDPAGPVEVIVEQPLQMPEGWEHAHTNTTHIIYVPTSTVFAGTPMLDEGDWIGAFYEDNGMEYCGGAALWHNNDTIKIVAFGDNPQTTQKEGFEMGESISWKAYMDESGDVQPLDVDYHSGMPDHDGKFHDFGLSMLISIDMMPTGLQDDQREQFQIYPNPSGGLLNISAESGIKKISVFSISGQKVYESQNADNQTIIDLTGMNRGIYFAKVFMENGNTVTKKVILE